MSSQLVAPKRNMVMFPGFESASALQAAEQGKNMNSGGTVIPVLIQRIMKTNHGRTPEGKELNGLSFCLTNLSEEPITMRIRIPAGFIPRSTSPVRSRAMQSPTKTDLKRGLEEAQRDAMPQDDIDGPPMSFFPQTQVDGVVKAVKHGEGDSPGKSSAEQSEKETQLQSENGDSLGKSSAEQPERCHTPLPDDQQQQQQQQNASSEECVETEACEEVVKSKSGDGALASVEFIDAMRISDDARTYVLNPGETFWGSDYGPHDKEAVEKYTSEACKFAFVPAVSISLSRSKNDGKVYMAVKPNFIDDAIRPDQGFRYFSKLCSLPSICRIPHISHFKRGSFNLVSNPRNGEAPLTEDQVTHVEYANHIMPLSGDMGSFSVFKTIGFFSDITNADLYKAKTTQGKNDSEGVDFVGMNLKGEAVLYADSMQIGYSKQVRKDDADGTTPLKDSVMMQYRVGKERTWVRTFRIVNPATWRKVGPTLVMNAQKWCAVASYRIQTIRDCEATNARAREENPDSIPVIRSHITDMFIDLKSTIESCGVKKTFKEIQALTQDGTLDNYTPISSTFEHRENGDAACNARAIDTIVNLTELADPKVFLKSLVSMLGDKVDERIAFYGIPMLQWSEEEAKTRVCPVYFSITFN